VIRRGDIERGANGDHDTVRRVRFAALDVADRRRATAGELAELSLRDLLAAAAKVNDFAPGSPVDIYHHGGIIARLSTAGMMLDDQSTDKFCHLRYYGVA